jgi:hypothetical protein
VSGEFCTCQQVSRNVFDCPLHGERLRADSVRYQAEQESKRQARVERRADDAEYARGVDDTRRAQEAGPAGSAAREQAYLEMEAQWAREGHDG